MCPRDPSTPHSHLEASWEQGHRAVGRIANPGNSPDWVGHSHPPGPPFLNWFPSLPPVRSPHGGAGRTPGSLSPWRGRRSPRITQPMEGRGSSATTRPMEEQAEPPDHLHHGGQAEPPGSLAPWRAGGAPRPLTPWRAGGAPWITRPMEARLEPGARLVGGTAFCLHTQVCCRMSPRSSMS